MARVVCTGELLIDFVPTVTPVGLIEAPAFKKAPGGAPANVAVGLSRLGVASAFMGKVGDDPFGHFLRDTLAEAGVDTTPLRFAAEARTALAFVSLNEVGDREFMFYRHPSADMLFTPEEVDAAALQSAEVLHFGSISLISEPSRSATLHAVKLARDGGALISYDPNLRAALWADLDAARTGMTLGWGEADIIKVSDEEITFLGGEDGDLVERARRLWHDRLRLLVITRAADGCTFLTRDFTGSVDAFPVTAVDTTGAGDGFLAGLLKGLLDQPDALTDEGALARLCRFACAVGSLTTTGRGAIPALPELARVQAFLAEHNR